MLDNCGLEKLLSQLYDNQRFFCVGDARVYGKNALAAEAV